MIATHLCLWEESPAVMALVSVPDPSCFDDLFSHDLPFLELEFFSLEARPVLSFRFREGSKIGLLLRVRV